MNETNDLELFISEQRRQQQASWTYVQDLLKDIDLEKLAQVDVRQMDDTTRQALLMKHGLVVDEAPKKRDATAFRQKTRAIAC